jgi:hypothetical protein
VKEKREPEKTTLTDPASIKALFEKTLSYRIKADLYKCSTGNRFPKKITADPVFKSIRYCQSWYLNNQMIQQLCISDLLQIMGGDSQIEGLQNTHEEILKNLRAWSLSSYDPQPATLLAKEFTDAAMQGDIDRLSDLVKLCELYKTKVTQPPREHQSDSISWYYYVGIGACQFLIKGIVPTKKQVKEAALQCRAIYELTKGTLRPIRESAVTSKIKELRALPCPNWTRIFRELGLSSLPSAPAHA